MRRAVLATLGTIVALIGLLSFKSHSALPASSAGLPSASLATAAAPAPRTPAPTSSSAPPNRSRRTTATTKTTTTTAPKPSTATRSATAPTPSRTAAGSTVRTRYGIVQVKVVTTGKRITAVSFLQLTAFDGHSAQINSDAGPQLLQQTLTAQSAHVDGVSGATYTSDGYRTSLQYALDQVGIH